MGDIDVSFVHPEHGRIMAVTLDDSMTVTEAVGELLANSFLPSHPSGYKLSKTGNILRGDQTFAEAGITAGSSIHIFPTTEAGGEDSTPVRNSKGRIIGKGRFKNVKIADLQDSPQAISLMVHDYNVLQKRFETLAKELNDERSKSQSRFTATLLLLVSQLVLSIGANLLTSNRAIAIPVLIAGGCQVALALYLTFRKSSS
jgi:hypothetical protein